MKKIILGIMLLLSLLSFAENQSKVGLLYVKESLTYNSEEHIKEFDKNSKLIIEEMEKKGYKLVNVSSTEITQKIGYGSGNNGILYTFIFQKEKK